MGPDTDARQRLAVGSGDFACDMEAERHSDVDAGHVTNTATAKPIIRDAARRLPATRGCACASAAKHALMTDPALVGPEVRRRLALIIGQYLPKEK